MEQIGLENRKSWIRNRQMCAFFSRIRKVEPAKVRRTIILAVTLATLQTLNGLQSVLMPFIYLVYGQDATQSIQMNYFEYAVDILLGFFMSLAFLSFGFKMGLKHEKAGSNN
jgi:hypothetical protein